MKVLRQVFESAGPKRRRKRVQIHAGIADPICPVFHQKISFKSVVSQVFMILSSAEYFWTAETAAQGPVKDLLFLALQGGLPALHYTRELQKINLHCKKQINFSSS